MYRGVARIIERMREFYPIKALERVRASSVRIFLFFFFFFFFNESKMCIIRATSCFPSQRGIKLVVVGGGFSLLPRHVRSIGAINRPHDKLDRLLSPSQHMFVLRHAHSYSDTHFWKYAIDETLISMTLSIIDLFCSIFYALICFTRSTLLFSPTCWFLRAYSSTIPSRDNRRLTYISCVVNFSAFEEWKRKGSFDRARGQWVFPI